MLRVMSSLSLFAVVSSSFAVGGCGGTPANAQIRVCYASAASEDAEPPIDDRTFGAVHTGLFAANPDTSWAAPQRFTDCGATNTVELIDDDGAHVWLGVDVVNDGEPLVSPATFADIVEGELRVSGSRIWTTTVRMTLSSSEELRLALQDGLPLDDDDLAPFAVTLEDAGADGLAPFDTCVSATARQLGFHAAPLESGPTVLKNSEVAPRGEYVVANLGSWEYGESGCEDVPANESLYSWAIVIDR